MVKVTATDFKTNLGKYLTLVWREDIHITKNGADIAVLTSPAPKDNWVDKITGVIAPVDDIKRIKSERLAQKHENIT